MKRTLITERDILDAAARGCTRLEIPHDAVVTPLAADTAAGKKVLLIRSAPGQPQEPSGPATPHMPAPLPQGAAGTTARQPGSATRTMLPEGAVASATRPAARPQEASPQTPLLYGTSGQTTIARTSPQGQQSTVVIGSDHGGFELKAQLAEHLRARGIRVEDVGTKTAEPCDYPDFAYAVAWTVAAGRAPLGIMIDGAGIGSCMVVNKIPGIRGACCTHEFMARNAREHNNANVLTLGSRVVGLEVAKAIVDTFLRTEFAGGRHEGRVRKITDVDDKFRRL